MTEPSVSLDDIGQNFSVLRNLMRSKDQLIRQPGWVLFEPDGAAGPTQAVYDGTETVLRLAELIRPNGDRVWIAASQTKIKKFDTGTWTWTTIGSGYSSQGKRWQVMTTNGYLILNNTVDLPQAYREEWAAVLPDYEMREVGIAAVGRITEYNGFLFLGDVTEIQADQLAPWMNGYSSYVPTSTVTKNANYALLLTDTTKEFDVTTGASAITFTFPAGAPPTWWVKLKKVDAGAGTLITSPVLVNQPVVLAAIGDVALVWSNGDGTFSSQVFPGGALPATNPYGIPPTAITNHFPYEVAWSEFGEPTHWAPQFSVYMPAASATLTLPFASQVFFANQTFVAVVGGGADEGVLGGQSDTPNGVLVTAVAGNQITLAESTDPGITYPRTVTLMRFTDVSTIVGKSLLQGDGSQIIGLLSLQGQVMIYRKTGIYVGRYTGTATNPFAFRERYIGSNVPMYGDCVASVNGDFHLYPGVGGRFYAFDGINEPQIYKPCDNARDLFFAGLDGTEACFVVDNPLTKQLWFCRPGTTFAFSYEYQQPSEIDTQIDAAGFGQKPGSTDRWFVLGQVKTIMQYALVNGVASSWLRAGAAAPPYWLTGLMSFGDESNEKDVVSYTPILASPSPDVALQIQLYGTYNPSAPLTALMDPVAALPDPEGSNLITMFFRSIYFQEEMLVTDSRDIDLRFSARIYEIDRIDDSGVTRTGAN